MLSKPIAPIAAKDSVWPDIQSALILPPGKTKTEAFAIHSMPNLLTDFDPKASPVQLVPHRGIPDYANGIPDGCMAALRSAIAGKEREGGNLAELDPLWIDGCPFIMHDLTGDCQTLSQKPWSHWKHDTGRPIPKFIVLDVQGSDFTEKYVPTNFPVTSLHDCMQDLLLCNPSATLFLDGQNEDGANLVALISTASAYQPCVVVQLYPYAFETGDKFVNVVSNLNPGPDWKRTVAILNADTLPMLTQLDNHSLDYSALYDAGEQRP